jgi:hypothetical protein
MACVTNEEEDGVAYGVSGGMRRLWQVHGMAHV